MSDDQPTTWLGMIGGALGGGTLVALINGLVRRREVDSMDNAGERDAVAAVAEEDREDRRRLEGQVSQLSRQVVDLSVSVARCEEQHAATRREHAREREERQSLADDVLSLKSTIALLEALVDKQRQQIDQLVRSLMDAHQEPAE